MSVITLVFCSCSPVITLPAWILFYIARLVHGELLVFVEKKKPDLGGYFWVEAIKQMFIGLLIYLLLMFGILSTYSSGCGPPLLAASAVVPLFLAYHSVMSLV